MASRILSPSRALRHQLKNQPITKLRNFCHCKKPKQESPCKSDLPEPNDCEAAKHEPRQPEAFACDPDCRKGKPNIPPRGCLPWEKGSELCQQIKKLHSPTCEHFCESYAGQEVVRNLEMTTCEFRKFEKCVEKTHDGSKCLDVKPKTGLSKKVYPMLHAGSKINIAGSPVKEHSGFIVPKKN